MTRMFSFKAMLAASVCVLPLQAIAQSASPPAASGAASAPAIVMPPSDNWISAGAQYNSGPSYYLNRFTGAVHPGFYGLGDLNFNLRDAWNSGGTRYFQAQGHDLGFDSRSINIEGGEQGTWGLSFSYDGIPYQASDDFHSVWTGSGGLVPGVAPGGLPLVFPARPAASGYLNGSTAVNSLWLPVPSPTLAGHLYTYDIGTKRDIFTGTGKYIWGEWTITGAIRHDHKTGYQANSFEIGGPAGVTFVGTGGLGNKAPTTGVTSALGYFAMPIDYDMDRYDLTAAYSTSRLQVQLGYTFSEFTDNSSTFNAINPFGLNPTTTFGTAAANLSVPYSMPPSNSAHQVKLMVGYNITPTTRLNANFAYGLELQNAPYDLATGDPRATLQEPRSSFDGMVRTLFGNVAITSEPIPRLDLRLAYTIDDRDNQSPRNGYEVDTRSNTSTAGNGDCGFGGLCYNLPFSFDHQMLEAEAGYRILPQTKISLTDRIESTYRNYADASFVTANTVTAKVRSEIVSDVFGTLSYSHQDRDANNYVNGNTWALLSGGGVESNPNGFLMYFEASRKHDDVKGTLDLSPVHNIGAELMVKFSKDRYPDSQYGMRNNTNLEIGPDVNWQIMPTLTAHAYYTFQQIYYDQSSLYTSGTNYTATGTGYYVPYSTKTTDSVHTFGISMDWKAIPDKLKLSVDYNFSYGDTAYLLGDGAALIGGAINNPTTIAGLNFQPLPDITSTLNMIQLRGEYTFRPNMTVIFGYAYERFDYKDFMYTGNSTQYANVLLPGTVNPNESVHVVGAGLRYRF